MAFPLMRHMHAQYAQVRQSTILNNPFKINPYPTLSTITDSTRGPLLGLLTLLTTGEREQVSEENETRAKQALMQACVCSNQCYKKGMLVCKSSCHGCPALHYRTGLLAPHDNHSLAEGHLVLSNLTSNHGAIF